MIQLNPADLDLHDFKIDNSNLHKNKTLKNKKHVNFNVNEPDSLNRDNFNYNYNSVNKPSLNNNKKIRNLSNLISKLHNQNENDDNLNEDNDENKNSFYKNSYKSGRNFSHNADNYNDENSQHNNNEKLNHINNINPNVYDNDNNNMINNNYNDSLDLMNYNSNKKDKKKEDALSTEKFIELNKKTLSKLDNILNLLEEQKSERTHHVTEELILYVFLGFFIIYIIDSFARVGKYVR